MTTILVALVLILAVQCLFIAFYIIPRFLRAAGLRARWFAPACAAAMAYFFASAVTATEVAWKGVSGALTPDLIDDFIPLRGTQVIALGAFLLFLRHLDMLVFAKGQKEAIAQADAQRQVESLSVMTSGAAHDFSNILGVINILAKFALEDIDNLAELRSDLQQIATATQSGVQLTERMKEFSQSARYEPAEINVNAVLAGLHPMLSRVHKDVTIYLDLQRNLQEVLGDVALIERSVINLVKNSCDAGAARVWLATRNTGAGTVIVRASDDGCGMEPEVREKALAAFFTTKTRGEGTGLGLASVYGMVTQAGGTIDVRSTPGKGTWITLAFPAVAPA